MTKELVTIEGQEYVVAPNGAICDDDGNVCGFLGTDIVGGEDNFVDSYMSSLNKEFEQKGAKGRAAMALGRRAGMAFTAPAYAAMAVTAMGAAVIGAAAKDWYDADQEADRAVERAEQMDRRVERHRKSRRR